MTTIGCGIWNQEHVLTRDLREFPGGLDTDSSLFAAAGLWDRLAALDQLDAGFGDFDPEWLTNDVHGRTFRRAKIMSARLEAANAELYRQLRSEMMGSGRPQTLLRWIDAPASKDQAGIMTPGFGFDHWDELLNGILQLSEPREPMLQADPEMVFYQPTPARHIFELVKASGLSAQDVFVDLGSGLGRVPLLASMLTGAECRGIEVETAYVASARECAESLQLTRVGFIEEDAREADFSSGTVFYLYSPFTGSILAEVLRRLRHESRRRPLRICSFGPCTATIADQTWLKAGAGLDAGRITVFHTGF